MIDMVPKAITLTLVAFSKENLQRELLQELYKQDVLDELLKESEFVVNRRKEVVSMVQALNKAEECVSVLSSTISSSNLTSLELSPVFKVVDPLWGIVVLRTYIQYLLCHYICLLNTPLIMIPE